MHHSDRGSQYCCEEYVERLEGAGVAISMTQENHCYENGQAERLNGILKQEYGLGGTFGVQERGVACGGRGGGDVQLASAAPVAGVCLADAGA